MQEDWMVGVPFVSFNNRRALTDQQLQQRPDLGRLVRRYREYFERFDREMIWVLKEDVVGGSPCG